MKTTAEEFIFLREKLKEIALCLKRNDIVEAAFLVGCLHSICNENITRFEE